MFRAASVAGYVRGHGNAQVGLKSTADAANLDAGGIPARAVGRIALAIDPKMCQARRLTCRAAVAP